MIASAFDGNLRLDLYGSVESPPGATTETKQASGYAHVKTGTIDHVSAVAGYVMDRSGKRRIVAGMLNHRDAHRGAGKELMNALVAWAHAQ